MVNLNHEKPSTSRHLISFDMQCVYLQTRGLLKTEKRKDKDNILVFIKAIVFQSAGILWLIKATETKKITLKWNSFFGVQTVIWYNQNFKLICADTFLMILIH